MYVAVSSDVTAPIDPEDPVPSRNVSYRISSLLKNPERNGTPAIASEPIRNVQYVIGRYRFSPPMLRMSCSPCSA